MAAIRRLKIIVTHCRLIVLFSLSLLTKALDIVLKLAVCKIKVIAN